MASTEIPAQTTAERQWFALGRWQEFEGEGRANLLRLVGLVVFYAIELVNYHGLNLGALQMPRVVDRAFHLSITILTLAWFMLCVGVLVCRKNGIFPAWLKFLSTGCDLLLLTTVLALADGPSSPLVVAYFLVITLATLRFSLSLIWFATAGAVAGYLFLLGFVRWGPELPWPRSDGALPPHQPIIFVVSLVLIGVLLGQVIRRVSWLVHQLGAATRGPLS